MAFLTFYRGERPVMRHPLKGAPVNMGRDASCEIQLLDDEVSRVHVSILFENGSYILTDKSSNGTFINDTKVTSQRLANGDIISLGGWHIRFEEDGQIPLRETVIKDASHTKILKYEVKKKELVSEETMLTIITPDGGKKERSVSSATIGSSPSCDITIDGDEYVSGRHCAIRCDGGPTVVEDLGSRNGTLLNGERIDKISLPERGELTIGRTTIKFARKQKSEKIRPATVTSIGSIVGRSEAIREIFSLIERIAPSDVTTCLIGPSGTGKELLARHIHEASGRNGGPFVALNCGAIPAALIESELFGHERGAFTSATSQHRGVFEQASGGTLFLDEIGEMPLDLQTRLLRVLETRQIRRVGGQSDIPVNIRIVAATNRNLKEQVKKGHFREDLFYRLFVVPIMVPPLCKRKEDIPMLSEHFLSELLPEGSAKRFCEGAIEKLTAYNWPGNVRELKNTVQRAVLISTGDAITADDVTFMELEEEEDANVPLEEQEKRSVISAIIRAKGNTSEAARILGIARTTVIAKLKRFGINADDYKMTS